MNLRLAAGTLSAFIYNVILAGVPSRTLRHAFLRNWLGKWGEGSGVQMGCRFLNGRKVYLGRRTVVNFGCILDGRIYPIHVGNDVSIGPEAAILTLGHDPMAHDFADQGGPVVIGDRVWIGYRAIILPGVKIGEGAVVAAGAVVTKNVAPFSIVAGVPARAVRARSRQLDYSLEYRPWLT